VVYKQTRTCVMMRLGYVMSQFLTVFQIQQLTPLEGSMWLTIVYRERECSLWPYLYIALASQLQYRNWRWQSLWFLQPFPASDASLGKLREKRITFGYVFGYKAPDLDGSIISLNTNVDTHVYVCTCTIANFMVSSINPWIYKTTA
jgi:hypothetical protein